MDHYKVKARLFKALMHPARLAILDVLRDGEHCVCHIEAHLGYRQAYISQQLMVLRDAGLVEDRRDGWNNYYRTAKPRIYDVLDAMAGLATQNREPAFARSYPPEKKPCPCPKCNPARSELEN